MRCLGEYPARCLIVRILHPFLVFLVLAIMPTFSIFADPPPVTFEEISDSAGVREYPDDGNAVMVDFNGDGFLDISSGKYLYKNLGNLTFEDVTDSIGYEGEGWRVSGWSDFNNDGCVDVVITGAAPKLYLNDEGYQFLDVTSVSGLTDTSFTGCSWVDYDKDGWVDLLLFGSPVSTKIKLYHNDGDETFTDVTESSGLPLSFDATAAAFFDYDNDGDQDLLLSRFWDYSGMFRNNGDSTFTDVSVEAGILEKVSMGIAIGDYDNDGWFDVFLGSWGGDLGDESQLFRNLGDGSFQNVTDEAGLSHTEEWIVRNTLFEDFNNDGWVDIFETGQGYITDYSDRLYLNNGDGTFLNYTEQAGVLDSMEGDGTTSGDIDNDGYVDLFVKNFEQWHNYMYHNLLSQGSWLILRLVGTSSNQSAIGARARVVVDSLSMIREVSGGSGRYSQNSLQLELGLGETICVDSVIINWPDSVWSQQVFTNIIADEIIEIVQDSSFRGDANNDGEVTIADAVYLVIHVFKSGPPPIPVAAGDVNCSCTVTIEDVVYIVNYLFKSGPEPCN